MLRLGGQLDRLQLPRLLHVGLRRLSVFLEREINLSIEEVTLLFCFIFHWYLFELEPRRLDEGEEEVERDEDGRGHDEEQAEGLAVPRVDVGVVVRQRRVLDH